MRSASILSVSLLALALAACAGGPRADETRRAFLGSTAVPSAVIASELAFARTAREKGALTAIRETATDDAIRPGPGWENVKAALRGTPDPAAAVVREADQVWLSCDGSFALSSGPATYPSGKRMRFATIWQRQNDGRYRWVLDQGLDLEAGYGKPDMIAANVAECGERRRGAAIAPAPKARRGLAWQSGESDDGTLRWSTALKPDCSRDFAVQITRGGAPGEVFRRSAAPPSTAPGTAPPRCAV